MTRLRTPQLAVGAVVLSDNKILLEKRKKEPNLGQWAIPGGSVQLGETLQEAVEREIREETGLMVKARDIVHTFEVIERDDNGRIRFHYVIIDLNADVIGGKLHPSDDALDARWFGHDELKKVIVTESTQVFLRKSHFIE